MRGITGDAPVYLWLGVMDMRVGFDRLVLFTRERMKKNVLSGGHYVFLSRKRDRVKILYWDVDGYAMWHKRLECGVFRVERRDGEEEINGVDLYELLRGVELNRIKFRKKVEKRIAPSS